MLRKDYTISKKRGNEILKFTRIKIKRQNIKKSKKNNNNYQKY